VGSVLVHVHVHVYVYTFATRPMKPRVPQGFVLIKTFFEKHKIINHPQFSMHIILKN